MPFLIPALVSGVSDVLILVLQEHRQEGHLQITQLLQNSTNTSADDDDTVFLRVHHVQYLAVAAVLRLLLLLFPLPYHSYTGTAIRFSFCYQLFYAITLTAVLCHMLVLSMMDPYSIGTLLHSISDSNAVVTVQQHLSRSCWWILLLSLLSVLCHIVMLIHVRSTAPSIEYMPYHALGNGRKKRLLYYYTSQQPNMAYATEDSSDGAIPVTLTLPSTPMRNDDDNDLEQNSPEEDVLMARPEEFPTSPMQKLTSQYDDFVTEMRESISLLKKDWTHKLDDFTQRRLNSSYNQAKMLGNAHHHHPHHTHNNPLLPLTPFRVLLQLFAYQDVIDSGKLDAVFDMDQGQSLTFFVPQLLSFLLHGAYYEADPTKLEAWILDKCSNHVHFAHRCYWFLKAWSLQESYESLSKLPTPRNSSNALQEQGTNGHHKQASDDSELSISLSQSSLVVTPKTPANNKSYSRSSSWGSFTGGTPNGTPNPASALKLLPEERVVVENLLLRVVQCGETSARKLQYGLPPTKDETPKKRRGKRDKKSMKKEKESNGQAPKKKAKRKNPDMRMSTAGLFWDTDGNDESDNNNNNASIKKSPSYTLVPELVMTPEMEASLPVDPSTGFPSHRHLETLTAKHRFGFMPWAHAKKEQALMNITGTPMDSFHATPRFLDALLAIADGLFLVPRDQRKKQLRLQLQSLEVEMLPSNAIYIPISNPYHRVWRIVAEESIALNTKERVPCIILFEVVDYNPTKDEGPTHNHVNGCDDSNFSDGEDGLPKSQSWDGKRSKEVKRSLELPKLELPKLGMPKRKKKRTKSDRSPKKGAADSHSHSDNEWEPIAASPTNSTTSGSLPFSLPYYTMMGGMTEAEIVNHWRYARRDPHRGESILDKMASSLPLDMNRMKEKFNKHMDKQGAIFEDLLGFTNSEDDLSVAKEKKEGGAKNLSRKPSDSWLVRDKDSEIAAFLCNDPYENTTYENTMLPDTEAATGDKNNSRDVSPERVPSDLSMGQWTSPVAERPRIISINDIAHSKLQLDSQFAEVDQKQSYQRRQDSRGQERMSTAYGSTYDGRGQTSNVMDGRPPLSGTPKNNGGKRTPKRKPPQQVVFRENWQAKEDRLRPKSAFGSNPGWRLLPILVKANDDLRQEELASQLIRKMAFILAREHVPVWLCPYEIIATTDRGGIVEAIPDTISLDSLKRNDPNFIDLNTFFHSYFGDNVDDLADAKSNFVESLAAYSIVTFLLQVKDRHNGNILLDNRGHLIHIDFGFFFLSSPGKNTGFESAPFKLTRDFVEVLGGPESPSFRTFRELCVRSFLVLRRHCMEIILLVEMLKSGNEDLACFLGRPDDAIKGLRERFRLDLSDRACREYVQSLIDESLENWRTNWYDRYQRYCVGVL